MSEISKVQLGENGTIYNIKDASAIRGIKINGESVAASNNIVDLAQYGGYYGVCSTAAATAIKDVSCTGFVLQTGSIITVRFTVTNTAAVADLQLNVNSTGAKNIKYRNGNLSSVGVLSANRTYLFVYDGTYWQIIGDLNTDTYDRTVVQTRIHTGSLGVFAYSLVALDKDQKMQPLTTTGGASTTKTFNTSAKFLYPPEIMYHYTGTAVAANGVIANSVLYEQFPSCDLRYSCNVTTSSGFTQYKPLYIECEFDNNWHWSITSTGLTQTFTQGKYYILLGCMYNTSIYQLALFACHPVFYYNGTNLVQYMFTAADRNKLDGIASGATKVSASSSSVSGATSIKSINIDGTSYNIYDSGNTDTKVTQTNSTSDGSYRVLLSGNANDTTETTTSHKSGKLLFNPSSGVLSVDNALTINYSGSQTRLVRYTSTGSYFVSPPSGGWAGGMSYRNSTDDTSLASIGVYGSGDTINYAYIGTTYNTPWFKITPTGESTFTNSTTVTNGSGPLYFIASRTDTDFSLQFGVQSSGTYGGIYANTANTDRWILQYDETDLSLFTRLHTDTEETGMYAVPFFGDTPSSARKTLLNSNGFRYVSKYGSTTEEGAAQLVLGTGVATGSNANMTGSIRIYSSDTGYHIIKGEATSTTQNITIPDDSGTLMLLGTPGNSIPESADLNTSTYYDTSKHFYSQNSSISSTLVNTPFKSTGFQLFNIPIVSDSYLKQVAIPNDDAIPFLYRYKTPSNTSTWRGPGTGFYYVKGTQTSATNVWAGNLDIPELYDGLTIAFYLPYSGTSSSATLNLTLSTGESTGAIPVYYSGTSRATTHYTAGSTVVLTYWGAGSISVGGTNTTEARWTRSDYNSNNYVTQNIRASTVTTKYPLLLSAYDTSSSSTSAASVYRTSAIYAQPSTGKITANGYSLTPVSGSEQPELFNGTVSSGNNITCSNTSHSWSNYNLILLKIGPASGNGSATHFIYLPFKWLIENVDANTQFRSYELSQVNAQLYITNATKHGFTLGLSSGTWSSTTKVTCIAII